MRRPETVALRALAFVAFAVGGTKLLVAGILPDLARGLGTTVPAAGQLATVYAVALMAGAPLAAAATARLGRRAALLVLLALFLAGDVAAACATSLPALVAARALSAPAHGAIVGVAAVLAAGLVPAARRGDAIGRVFLGFVLAQALAAPLAALLAQAAGWRAPFVAVAALAAAALAATWWLVPEVVAPAPPSLRAELRALAGADVAVALGVSVLAYTGVFAVTTFMVPLLTDEAHVPRRMVPLVLLLTTVAPLVGTRLGGRRADRAGGDATGAALLLLAASLALVGPARQAAWALVLVATAMGLAAAALAPMLEARIIAAARGAPNVASTLRLSAVNLANALGAAMAGALLAAGRGWGAVGGAGAALALAALALVAATGRSPDAAAVVGHPPVHAGDVGEVHRLEAQPRADGG